MNGFKELEISDFLGIATSTRHPKKNECQECKNFDTRFVDGDLTLRPGFSEKYAAPVSADHRGKLSSVTYLNFANFTPEGTTEEVTVWVGKGTCGIESGSSATSKNIIVIFSSHQFITGDSETTADIFGATTIGLTTKTWTVNKYTGLTVRIVSGLGVGQSKTIISNTATTLTVSTWTTTPDGTSVFVIDDKWMQRNWDGITTGKYWLNHTILAKVGSVASSPNQHRITLDCTSSDLVSDKLNNWSVYNIDKDDVAQVIDTVDAGSGVLRIDITKNTHNWASGDNVVIMRNYIPYTYLTGMYSCVAGDIEFHKVLNDLRIGFGGQENRIGLSVGYRKKYFNIGGIDFGSYTTEVEGLATVNNIILDPYMPDQGYGLLVTTVTGVSGTYITAGKYWVKMTALLDGFNEVLLAETNYDLPYARYLNIQPIIKFGAHNKRLTHLKYYVSVGTIGDKEPVAPFFLLKTEQIAFDIYAASLWSISDTGELYQGSTTEIMTDNNAVIDSETDYNASTGFTAVKGTMSVVTATPPPHQGTYSLKFVTGAGSTLYGGCYIYYAKTGLFKTGNKYTISAQAIANTNLSFHFALATGGVSVINGVQLNNASYTELTGSFTAWKDFDYLFFVINNYNSADWFAIDSLSIQQTEIVGYNNEDFINLGADIVDALGYEPTFDMIKSWDQAVVTQGRTFFVNPYIDKRYENKVFASHISGAGAFMYDAASAERYIDLENFDGNKLVGIEILPNLHFLALKTNGSQRVDPNTGATRGISFGDGCVSRRGIVNFGDRVVWTGENDIYMTDGLNTISIADKSIREEYRAITNKGNIIAVREEKDNAYRFFTGNTTTKTEYILTRKGWIKKDTKAGIYPIAYALETSGQVNFLYNGIIYDEDESTRDPSSNSVIGVWQSVDIDNELIGEGITERDFIYINSMWVYYTRGVSGVIDPNMQMILTADGSVATTKNFTTIYGKQKLFIPIPSNGITCRRFNVKVAIVDDGEEVKGKNISIHSVGVIWKIVKSGHYN